MRDENETILKEKKQWEAVQTRLQQQVLEQADNCREECRAHIRSKELLEATRRQLAELQKELQPLKDIERELEDLKAQRAEDEHERANMATELEFLQNFHDKYKDVVSNLKNKRESASKESDYYSEGLRSSRHADNSQLAGSGSSPSQFRGSLGRKKSKLTDKEAKASAQPETFRSAEASERSDHGEAHHAIEAKKKLSFRQEPRTTESKVAPPQAQR